MAAAIFLNIETLDVPLGMNISTYPCPSGKIAETRNELSNSEQFRFSGAKGPDFGRPSWTPIPPCTRITLQASLLYELGERLGRRRVSIWASENSLRWPNPARIRISNDFVIFGKFAFLRSSLVNLWLQPASSILKPWTRRLACAYPYIFFVRGKLPGLQTNFQILRKIDFSEPSVPITCRPICRQFPSARVLLFKHHCSTSYVRSWAGVG